MVATTAWLVAARLGPSSLTGRVLAVYFLGFAEIVALTLLLSLARQVYVWTILTGLAVLLVMALLFSRGAPPGAAVRDRLRTARRTFHDPVLAVLAATVAAGLLYSAALAIFTPPNEWDAMSYHLARAALWIQQHAVAYVPDSPVVMIDAYPPNAEIAALLTMLLSDGDRYVGLVQYAALVATAVATYGISRRVGFAAPAAMFGALVLLTTPVIALQGSAALNDLVVASFLGGATYFLLGVTRREFALGGLGLALAVGTKFTALIALPLVAVVVLAGQPRRQWRRVGIAGLAGTALGSCWLVVSLLATGSLDGGAREQLDNDREASFQTVLARSTRLLIGFADSLEVGRDALLYALSAAVLVVVLGVLWWRRGGRPWPALVALFAVACLPLAVPLVREGLFRAHESFWPSFAEPEVALLATEGSSRPPGSTYSYYGPTGLVLLVAGTFLVVLGVRRRELRRLTALLAVSPFVSAVLIALASQYEPYRGRFFMYSVSLAAATWGVVLRKRWLAWGVVSIASVTLLLAFVHSAEKPTGLRLLDLSRTTGVWGQPRPVVQAWVRPGDTAEVIQFFAGEPTSGRVGLRIEDTDWVYPYFGDRLDREVFFVPPDVELDDVDADWLVLSERQVGRPGSRWALAFRSEDGWRVYRRAVDS